MPVVQMPDGALVDMPDNPTPAQLEGLRKLQGGGGALDNAVSYGKKALGDLARGFLQSPTVQALQGVVAANPANLVTNKLIKPTEAPITADMVRAKLPERQPGYGTAATEAVGDFLANPISGVWGAAGAIGGGLGGELAARVGGEGPLSRGLGGLAGGLTTSAVAGRIGRLAPNVQSLAKESLEGITPQQLQAAKDLMARSHGQNVQMDLAQALEAVGASAGNMTTVRNVLANNKAGNKVQATLRAQPSELSILADLTVGKMPGSVYGEAQVANNLQEIATARLAAEKSIGSDIWAETLKRGEAALAASKTVDVKAAGETLRQKQAAQRVLADELESLRRNFSMAKASDQAAIEAKNLAVKQLQEKIAALESFTLPRGKVETNRGRFLELPGRGQSIDFDQIARETAAARLKRELPPEISDADSLQTALYGKRIQALEPKVPVVDKEVSAAKQELAQAISARQNIRRLPESTVAEGIGRLNTAAAEAPRTPVAKALQGLAKDLQGLTDSSQINEVLKAAVAKTKTVNLETPGMDAYAAQRVQAEVSKLREFFGESFTPIRDANKAFKLHREEVYEPLKQGVVGQIAGKGYHADTQAPVAKMRQIFESGVDPQASHSPIKQLAHELAKVDKTAFADAAKTHYSAVVQNAFEPVIKGAAPTNLDAAQVLWDKLFRPPLRYQGMKDTVSSIAETYGRNPAQAVKGLENFAQITKALKNTTKVGGLSREEVFQLGGKSYGADALRIFGFLPFERAARRLEARTMSNAFADFDKILTTPEGVDLLIQLSKKSVMSKEAMALLGGAQGTASAISTGANSPDVTRQ